jgi:site-specific DNA-methyltransferase (adenine-specific)
MKELIKKLEGKFPCELVKNQLLINADCLEVMDLIGDKSIDLVLTDPPYGIEISKKGKIGASRLATTKDYKKKKWDNEIPDKETFNKMFEISKNQIVFGGNYFAHLFPKSKRWIVWDKRVPDKMTFSGVELAWTSFKNNSLDFIRYTWHGMLQEDMKNKDIRIHPTQKPVGLFNKLLQDYSKENDLILDAFAGSFTTSIACMRTKRRSICIEKDKDYYRMGVERVKEEAMQGIFDF